MRAKHFNILVSRTSCGRLRTKEKGIKKKNLTKTVLFQTVLLWGPVRIISYCFTQSTQMFVNSIIWLEWNYRGKISIIRTVVIDVRKNAEMNFWTLPHKHMSLIIIRVSSNANKPALTRQACVDSFSTISIDFERKITSMSWKLIPWNRNNFLVQKFVAG